MKKFNIIFAIWIVGIAGLVSSCSELPFGQTPTDHTPPSPLSNVVVESIPGGAKVIYDLPNEKDISYVKCEYTYKGEKRIVRASVYNNYLIVEGLGTVEPIDITLYVVDHSENVSTGVSKTFIPDTPPLETIFDSVEIFPLFGGVSVRWTNMGTTEIGVTVFSEDSLGVMREGRTQYSKEESGELSFRGYTPVEHHFAVRITDKWGNVSGTKEAVIIPLFERLLDKGKFLEVALPGDNTSVNNNRPLKNCWDGNDEVIWHTVEGQFMPFPMYFTIDLGVEAKFSRMTLRARTNYYYSNHTFRTFEAWGAKDYKRGMPTEYWTGGDWKEDGDWEMLGDYEVKRPSGNTASIGNPGGEDTAYGQAGYGFNVPIDAEPLRYLRFVIKTTWSSGALHMAEFYFYGDDETTEN
ncbi:MAG: hypothetical protein EZS26_003229 [Candidatus Ordinivivax streblomastigis]|uniref:DUF4959 domain-containing protein n=1 Tax=Candidatus Ordinivivax streblomastigis TaxID=2540710 RepID=A0A5M8NVD1_9BACT|nr:MAG: hypothetical protein EZS26_003229 [Candidatus Ordinivivax streblomastigis]